MDYKKKRTSKIENSKRVAIDYLRSHGLTRQADRIGLCCTKSVIISRTCGLNPVALPLTCGLNGCPVCSGIEAIKRTRRLTREVLCLGREYGSNARTWRHIVLSFAPLGPRNIEILRKEGKAIYGAFSAFWRRLRTHGGIPEHLPSGKPRRYRQLTPDSDKPGDIKRAVNPLNAAHAALEYGSQSGLAHLHILYFGPWLDKRWLSEYWEHCTAKKSNPSKIVKINHLYFYRDHIARSLGNKTLVRFDKSSHYDRDSVQAIAKGIAEATKYVTAGSAKTATESLWLASMVALKGFRLRRRYGALQGDIIKDALAKYEKEDICPICGYDCGHWISDPIDTEQAKAIAETKQKTLPRPLWSWQDAYLDIAPTLDQYF